MDTKGKMDAVNMGGVNFSVRDMNPAIANGKPYYLVVPERNVVKVYRHPERCSLCEWVVEVL